MASPSNHQLEKHIRLSAQDTANIAFTVHARKRMRQRLISDPMVLEALRKGVLAMPPEPDAKHLGLLCRMQRFVAGVHVAVVVSVQYPADDLVVVTVIDVRKD